MKCRCSPGNCLAAVNVDNGNAGMICLSRPGSDGFRKLDLLHMNHRTSCHVLEGVDDRVEAVPVIEGRCRRIKLFTVLAKQAGLPTTLR